MRATSESAAAVQWSAWLTILAAFSCSAAGISAHPPISAEKRLPLPTSGTAVAALAPFDEAMQQFMFERHIKAGTLAVTKDGTLMLSRGYGWSDAEGKKPLSPTAPFRIASIAKPITAAIIRLLARQGKLRLDAKVVPLLAITPPRGRKIDPRWHDVTVQHLLDHQGGWDREAAFDPMFRPLAIAKALEKQGPASARDIIDYMAGEPLQFDPGTKKKYSNFGYCMLGRVIEKATGKSYEANVKELFAPLGVKDVQLGRTLLKDRHPREPHYSAPGRGRNVMQPQSKELVFDPDGTFHLEAMDAHGGLIASSVDLVKLLDAYWITGEPRRPGQKATFAFFGSLPGTHSMVLQRADGLSLAVLFNQRTDPSGLDYFEIREYLEKAAAQIKWQ
ncbi:MAG: beta-lactamase family protein [Gemmataceae bacterium]|nr:beta-lactamase family protein [Gemmataceae bacterium]MCI0739488.1 beta-lactamase family protein [Gemmataceae bacterium]